MLAAKAEQRGHMAQALHSGFERIEHDRQESFAHQAPAILELDRLVEVFEAALAREGATGHRCFALDGDGMPVLLTQSARMPLDGSTSVHFTIDIARDDQPLLLTIDCPDALDRHRRSRLHALAVIYAAHVVPLIEAEDAEAQAQAPTPAECQCMELLMAGLSWLDIGERLDVSAPAVGVYLRRAAVRLGASSPAEACAIAMTRGLLNPSNFGIGDGPHLM
jgi:DNA-binding CsgD family transcriptional regulator